MTFSTVCNAYTRFWSKWPSTAPGSIFRSSSRCSYAAMMGSLAPEPNPSYGTGGRSARAVGWTSAGIVGVVVVGMVTAVVGGTVELVGSDGSSADEVVASSSRRTAPAATTPPTIPHAITRLSTTRRGKARRTTSR